MKSFNDLRKINCNEYTERKGNLTYLSWTYALDILLQNDPMATWKFLEPIVYNDTIMVRTEVTALGKTLEMQLPVMDNKNFAIKSPDARKISDSQMRCIAKNIACFGIGLYIYAGSDLPADYEQEVIDPTQWLEAIDQAESIDVLRQHYINAVKACQGDQTALALLENKKDSKKLMLEQVEVSA